MLEHLIETRRTATTHVTVKNEPGSDCGTAPNPAQARNRETLNINYV